MSTATGDVPAQRVWLVLVRPCGPREQIARLLDRHIAHEEDLVAAGTALASGPFLGPAGPTGEGAAVLVAPSREDAERLAGEDPLVAAGLRTAQVHEWRVAHGSVGRVSAP